MCLLQPQPCDLKEVVAYKVMYYDHREQGDSTVTSIMTCDIYKLGQQYEAQEPPKNVYRVGISPIYSKGFHAYANRKDAREYIKGTAYPPHYYIVEVLLEDVTYEQKGVEDYEGDGVTVFFGIVHTYVANKCTFRKVLEQGKTRFKTDYGLFASKEIPETPITSA